jgi:hypothetical protein
MNTADKPTTDVITAVSGEESALAADGWWVANPIGPVVHKSKIDLVVLKYMAHRIRALLTTLEHHQTGQVPLIIFPQERRARSHRIVLYHPHYFQQNHDIAFVGFVGQQKPPVDALIGQEISELDERMLTELRGMGGVAGYSSLELRPGCWYNLVLLHGLTAKERLGSSQVHNHAAHKLAPKYYQWIRLHNGTIFGGLAPSLFTLRQTKYYSFPEGIPRVNIVLSQVERVL